MEALEHWRGTQGYKGLGDWQCSQCSAYDDEPCSRQTFASRAHSATGDGQTAVSAIGGRCQQSVCDRLNKSYQRFCRSFIDLGDHSKGADQPPTSSHTNQLPPNQSAPHNSPSPRSAGRHSHARCLREVPHDVDQPLPPQRTPHAERPDDVDEGQHQQARRSLAHSNQQRKRASQG